MALGEAGKKIITKGYGVNQKACEGIITTHFSLFCIKIAVIPPTGGGGAGYPYPAHNKFPSTFDIYKPVENLYYKPVDRYKDHYVLLLKIKIKQRTIEKYILLPKNKEKYAIKVINISNKIYDEIYVKHIRNNIKKLKMKLLNIKRNRTDK